jgi:hypothetical protein
VYRIVGDERDTSAKNGTAAGSLQVDAKRLINRQQMFFHCSSNSGYLPAGVPARRKGYFIVKEYYNRVCRHVKQGEAINGGTSNQITCHGSISRRVLEDWVQGKHSVIIFSY